MACFYDKTHTDIHGSLATTPFMFVPRFFNQECRNKCDFWNIFGYIPNMSYGRGKSDKSQPVDRLQDEPMCIYEAVKSLIDVHCSLERWNTNYCFCH